MIPKYLMIVRVRKNWRGKTYSFLVPMKGKIVVGPSHVYAPYVPMI